MQKTGVIAGSYHHRNALAGVRNIGGFIYIGFAGAPHAAGLRYERIRFPVTILPNPLTLC